MTPKKYLEKNLFFLTKITSRELRIAFEKKPFWDKFWLLWQMFLRNVALKIVKIPNIFSSNIWKFETFFYLKSIHLSHLFDTRAHTHTHTRTLAVWGSACSHSSGAPRAPSSSGPASIGAVECSSSSFSFVRPVQLATIEIFSSKVRDLWGDTATKSALRQRSLNSSQFAPEFGQKFWNPLVPDKHDWLLGRRVRPCRSWNKVLPCCLQSLQRTTTTGLNYFSTPFSGTFFEIVRIVIRLRILRSLVCFES